MRNITRLTIELDKEDIAWFRETYPNGSLQGILGMLLEKFREANTHTPKEYAENAAKTLTEELKK